MPLPGLRFRVALISAALVSEVQAVARPSPVLSWITNSSVKLEQIIGDIDWQAHAQGSNLPTASQTVSRFHVLGNGFGSTRYHRLHAPN